MKNLFINVRLKGNKELTPEEELREKIKNYNLY